LATAARARCLRRPNPPVGTRRLLRQVLPHVYAVGHVAESVEGDLISAILYAGPDAMLSHATALWWHELLEHRPDTTQVSTPRKCASRPDVQVHSRSRVELIHHRRLPTTTVSQAFLDFSSTAPIGNVVRALAEADYRRVLNHGEMRAICGYGRPGSTTLKQAIRQHTPELAQTKSKLERAFHALCGRAGIPPYKLNYRLCGITVDAFWPDLGVVVELDGVQGHASPAQMRRDHHRDLMLRAAGYIVVRYSYDQVTYEADTVVADLRRVLDLAARRGASAAATS
jgi:very-short-patch-repair endonuclease